MSKKADFRRLLQLDPEPWDLDLSEEDLLSKAPPEGLLFGAIPFERVLGDLEECGVAGALLARGYISWTPELTYRTPLDAQFRLWGAHPASPERLLLMDVRTRRGQVRVEHAVFRAMVWEWISLQDPMADFPPGVEPLPGQAHPGLGQFRVLNKLMLDYVEEVDVEALVAVPEYFHNAVLYSSHMRFYDPEREGRFQAMKRDLLGLGLAQASRAVADGRVEPAEGLWTPSEMVLPKAASVEAHFLDPEYVRLVETTRDSVSYSLR